MLNSIYRQNLSLLTDLYQLTMSYAYWKEGISEKESVFHLFFRSNPFKGGFTINCGLEYVIDYINNFKVSEEDARYLATLTAPNGTPLSKKILWIISVS